MITIDVQIPNQNKFCAQNDVIVLESIGKYFKQKSFVSIIAFSVHLVIELLIFYRIKIEFITNKSLDKKKTYLLYIWNRMISGVRHGNIDLFDRTILGIYPVVRSEDDSKQQTLVVVSIS